MGKIKYTYVGPKQATIENNSFFDASITLVGNGLCNNSAYSNELTFEYWNPDNDFLQIEFYNQQLALLKEPTKIMAHQPSLVCKCCFPTGVELICKNSDLILDILDNKIKTHDLMLGIVPMLNYKTIKGKDISFQLFDTIASNLVVQHPKGSGGSKTFLFNKDGYASLKPKLLAEEDYLVSEYLCENEPFNIHCVVGKEQFEIFAPSKQQLEISDKIEYIGSYYDIELSRDIKTKLISYSSSICKKLQTYQYYGVLGIDFIYANNELYFIEINPRFQGSTRQLDALLKQSELPSVFEYNFQAFYGTSLPSAKKMIHSIFL